MSVPALLAAAVIPLGAAHSGDVAGDGYYYLTASAGRSVVKRLDLETNAITTVRTSPNRHSVVWQLEADGDTLALEIGSRRAGTTVLAIDTETGASSTVAQGRASARECGHAVELLDVSPSGEVLFREAIVPCRTHRGRVLVRGYDADSGFRTFVERPEESTFLSSGAPYYALAGDSLVTWGLRRARVLDAGTGRLRRYPATDARSYLTDVDVAPDGRVATDEFRYMGEGKRPRQVIELHPGGIGGGRGRIVHRTRRAYGQLHFCGDRPVLETWARRTARLRLEALDPPFTVFDGRIGEPDGESSCGERWLVRLTITGDRGERAFVYRLPE